MTEGNNNLNKGDLVLVQPMRYCFTITEGGIEVLNEELSQTKMVNHWTGDGFKARVLGVFEHTSAEESSYVEEYVKVKIFGQGRKHFVDRNNNKTKIAWIQSRLVSLCRDEEGKKKKKK